LLFVLFFKPFFMQALAHSPGLKYPRAVGWARGALKLGLL